MLTKATVENFQSHKKTVLEFVPGVNVIIGPSDAGKSALFRAINWPISNRPLGDAFRSEWGGDTRVELFFAEGSTVERLRSPSRNSYILNGEELKAFGTEVPEEVEKAIALDGYNIQSQMDPPFLLSSTPGEAARMLNKAASIDEIDLVTSGIMKSLNRINTEIKHNERQLEEYAERMKQYEALPEIEKHIEQVEKKEEQQAKLSGRIASLKRLAARAGQVQHELQRTQHIPKAIEKVSAVEKLHHTYQTRKNEHQQLLRLTEQAKEIQRYLKQTESIEKAFQLAEKINDKDAQAVESRKRVSEIRGLVHQGRRVELTIKSINLEIRQLEKEYKELAPETCPLCGAKMR
jgi:exonuclease SbcC